MDDASTRESVLGTMVHRAVSLPFLNRQRIYAAESDHVRNEFLGWLGAPYTGPAIETAITESAEVLLSALLDADKRLRNQMAYSRHWPIAFAANVNGPMWDSDSRKFCELNRSERKWVIDRVDAASRRIAEWMVSEAARSHWRWAQSERDIWKDGLNVLRSRRIDLMAGTIRQRRDPSEDSDLPRADWPRPLDLWDYKVTAEPFDDSQSFDPMSREDMTETIRTYQSWSREARSPLRTAPIRIGLLYVHPDGLEVCRPDIRWLEDWHVPKRIKPTR